MEQGKNEHKNNFKVNSRPILILLIGLGFFTVILLSVILSVSYDKNIQNNNISGNKQDSNQEIQAEDTSDTGLLAVVKEINADSKQITLYDVNQQEAFVLNYTGGTNITDQYGQIISISQIEIGSMVDATYDKDKNKLTDMNVSKKAWEYIGVSNLSIDRSDRTMKIVDTLYKYIDDITILDGQEFISVANLAEQDELTIRGYEETIWSITVTRGHGTVVLENYEPFLGDNITIGYESMQQITEGLVITVREGNFNLTVENGIYSATKSIRVIRNQETLVSLSDLGPEAEKHGLVTFKITPFGADLYIDGELVSYANPAELLYGEHKIVVSLDQYIPYEGILKVDSAGKTLKIDLPEQASEETASVSESDTQTADPPDSIDIGTGDSNSPGAGDASLDTETGDVKHQIFVQKPLGASVYIDGDYMCTSPGSFNKLIGTHVITFIKEGYETMSYTIEVSDDGLDTYFTFPDLVATSE